MKRQFVVRHTVLRAHISLLLDKFNYKHVFFENVVSTQIIAFIYEKVNVKWSRYRPGVAQRVGRGIALFLHDRDTGSGWVVSSTPRPHFTPRKDTVPILQEAGWAPGSIWTAWKCGLHRDSILDRPARTQSLYRLELPGPHIFIYHMQTHKHIYIYIYLLQIYCHNTDYVRINGLHRTITLILYKHWWWIPCDPKHVGAILNILKVL